jgi:hypothetical protein
VRTHRGPFAALIGLARGLDRFVDVGLVALGNQAEDLFGCGVDGLEGLAGFGGDPFTAD